MSGFPELPASWPARGVFSLPCGDAEPGAWLDRVLEALRGAGLRTAWLPGEGGLVSNLSLIENCLLPMLWHERLDPETVEARFAAALAHLGLSVEEAGRFRQRPAQASARERQQTLFLRVLMQQPQVLVISGGALRGKYQGSPLDAVWSEWMSGSLLLYLGNDGPWPALTAATEQGG